MNAPAAPIPEGSPPLALLRLPEVLRRTGLGRSVLYREIAAGAFPAPVRLSERSTAWPEHEISAWIAARIAERGTK